MRKVFSVTLILLLSTSLTAFAQGPDRRSLALDINETRYSVDVDVPGGWSLSPRLSKNSHTLVNVGPGEDRAPTAHVQIFVQPRLDREDALNHMGRVGAGIPAEYKAFMKIDGWPAMQMNRIVEQEMPDNAPDQDFRQIRRVMTWIAVGDAIYIISGVAPASAGPDQVALLKSMTASLRFDEMAPSTDVESELDRLRAVKSRSSADPVDRSPRVVDLEPTPITLSVEDGANDRINTNGFGELEIATSPDGVNVVVALQSRRWVSSNNGGATFPNSGRVGAGNGDPSVAWGQSGSFYMAWIDNSANCASGYRDPVTVPPTAIYGVDCTGIARSDDNGVTFDPSLVNPAVVCPTRAPAGQPDVPNECFPDQEHIAADRWNPGDTPDDDNVYSTWRDFDPTDQDAAIVCSSDSGVTWTAPLTTQPGDVFPRMTVGSDGSVYVATIGAGNNFYLHKYTSCVSGLNPVAGWPRVVDTWDPFRCPFAGHDRCDQNPTSQTVIVDDTDPNHVYYAFVLDQEAAGNSHSDIMVYDSLDGGFTWGGAGRVVRANENVGARRIMPWLCATGGDAVVTWFEQRAAQPTDTTDYFGARVGLDGGGNLAPMEEFVLSEVPDNWCDIGWRNFTRWGISDGQLSNAAEACPNQPQLAGRCGDGDNPNVTPDSGIRCDFSDDPGGSFTNCLTAASSPSGNDERCLTGGGVPKYGDYNGNACAGGKLFAAWASANAPDGLDPPDFADNPGVLFEVINLSDLDVPVITIPGNVHFGDVCEGDDTLYQTLQVCNTGSADLQVDVITSDNDDFAVTVPSSGYPVTISPDFCFPFEVTYTPTGEPETAILTIPSDDPDRPTVEVTADASVGEANLVTIMDQDYGDVCLGDTALQQLTILNDGACDLEVTNASITSGSAEFEFATVMSFPFTLQAGESVEADVEFAPKDDIGAAAGEITITSDDPDTPSKVLDLDGNSPSAAVSTFIADSGVFADTCAADITDMMLTIDNTGACPLQIDSVTIALGANAQPGDFVTPDGDAAGTTVSSGNSVQVPIRFQPSAFDNEPPLVREADVNVASRTLLASSTLPTDTTPITGVVPPPDINLAIANDGDFGNVCKGDFADLNLTLFNQGACDLTISDISLDPPGGSFILPSDIDFPLVLSPDADFNYPIRYAPEECNDGLEEADVVVTSDDPDEPEERVDISGTSACPNLIIDPAALSDIYAFPATVVDTEGTLGCYSERTAVLRNESVCPLEITDISAAGDDFTVTAPTIFPITLPGGEETLEVTVRFTPQDAGDPLYPDETLGTLTVTTDDPDSPGEAELCGENVAQSGVRILATDITSGIPVIIDSVDSMTVRSKGKGLPAPINLQFTDVEPQMTTICGNDVYWHLDIETLPAANTEGGGGNKSSYTAKAMEGNLQDQQNFSLDQCELREFQLELRSDDGGDGGACNLLPKGAACDNDAECCSGKCKGPAGGKTCK